MARDIENDVQRQEDELVALSSIYDKTEFSYVKGERTKCSIKVCPKLLCQLRVELTSDSRSDSASGNSFLVEHLPPIEMYVSLPDTYPSKTRPNFHLSIVWLTPWDISFVCQKLDEIWKENEGCEIIFRWLNFLQNDIYDFLNIRESLDISFLNLMHTSPDIVAIRLAELSDHRARNDALSSDVKGLLMTYDKEQRKEQFYKNVYTCYICFEEYVGTHFIELQNCGHIYCRDCMEQHTRIKINECSNDISCPTVDCKREVSANDVKLLCPDLSSRYEDIALRVTLDTMDDVVYCPQISCGYPVIRDLNDDNPICPMCNYCFCIYCRKMYHGREPCEMTLTEIVTLIEKYEKSNDKEKKILEKKYGKRQMQLIERYLTTKYLRDNTKNCPKCHSFISKTDGCNKMKCIHCNALFCWLCNEQIHGYDHFNSPDNPCFGLLFQGMEVDDAMMEHLIEHFEDFNNNN